MQDHLTEAVQLALAPHNFDTQCSVLVAPANEPCARSITCKIHSISSKRAAAGRSAKYDLLYAEYQSRALLGRTQAAKPIVGN